jgi:hypothetical protein
MILRLALPVSFPADELLQEIENAGQTVGVTADLRPAG